MWGGCSFAAAGDLLGRLSAAKGLEECKAPAGALTRGVSTDATDFYTVWASS